jgi:hypothetical protein
MDIGRFLAMANAKYQMENGKWNLPQNLCGAAYYLPTPHSPFLVNA